MNHQKKGKKLARTKNQQVALMRSLACSLINHQKIVTTEAKAKELKSFIEKLVTKSKVDTLSSKRTVISRLNNKKATEKMFKTIAPSMKNRKGGYTRITKLPIRISDAAPMAQIEFIK